MSTTITREPMSFALAMKHYFGTRIQGEGASKDFMNEWKDLSDEDKKYFREELTKIGYVIT